MNYQIINSFLDTDWYKYPEEFYRFIYHPDAVVRYQLMNRSKGVRLADIIPIEAVVEQLDALRTLRFSETELAFLHGTGLFSRNILGFKDMLRGYQLPEFEIRVFDGQYVIEDDSILGEIPVLAVINELKSIYQMKALGLTHQQVWAELERTLLEAIPTLKLLDPGSVLEFGTRRRFSRAWQMRAYEILQNEVPDIVSATSNVLMAMTTGTPWAGTHPHASVMLEQGIAAPFGGDAVRASHNQFFTNWFGLFPYPYRVALTDTYGNGFWEDFTYQNAVDCRGLRWDSGPWRDWIDNKALPMFQRFGIPTADPILGKDAFYSDGLEPHIMVQIQDYARGKFRKNLCGWGTNATNNPGKYKAIGLKPVSLVKKPIAVAASPVSQFYDVIKLSANPLKATGNHVRVEEIKQIFDYDPADYMAEMVVY